MGNLHEGHLALVVKARSLATKTVVSLFVNPKPSSLSRNLVDADRRVDLAMARFASRVFATAKLLNDQLGSHVHAEDFCGDGSTCDFGLTDFHVRVTADGQYAFKSQFVTGRDIAEIDVEFLAFFHSELSAAVFDNRVHGLTR